MKYVLALFFTILPVKAYSSLDCNEVPDCFDLGFSLEDEEGCPENGYMYCPFNLAYKKCVSFQTTDCEELGFNQSDKSAWCASEVKCPKDETYTLCASGKAVANICNIGDIFYANGTCFAVDEYSPSLGTPIGVVFYVTNGGQHGKIVNLNDITFKEKYVFDPANPYGYSKTYKTIRYGLKGVEGSFSYYDTDSLKEALKDTSSPVFNGKADTSLMATLTASSCDKEEGTAAYTEFCVSMAGRAAVAFYPVASVSTNANYGAGQWWVPSIGELAYLYGFVPLNVTSSGGKSGADGSVIGPVNYALEKLASEGVSAAKMSGQYWSSTQFSASNAWKIDMSDGGRSNASKGTTSALRLITDF